MSLQERIDRWVTQALARLVQKMLRKLLAPGLGTTEAAPGPQPVQTRSAIHLHRDHWCGTYVSPEISVPLEQEGQMLHFCSAECRTRYQRSSQRAASA